MAGDGKVIVPPDSSGKSIDTSELLVSGVTVERQRIVIADPTSPTGLAAVGANGLKVDPSGVTQPISGSVTVQQSNIQLDYDTGAGTQQLTLFGMALPASGGAAAGGTASNPIRIDPTGTTPQPVSGTFWQGTQPVSATALPLPANAAQETGGNLATLATNTTGAAKDSSLTTLDTDLKATQPRDVTDRSARLLGHVTVDSATSLPLPTGAAQDSSLATLDADLKSSQPRAVTQVTSPWVVQENSGNLATIATQTRNDAQMLDCLNSILAQLKLLNLNFSSVCTPGSVHQDQDSFLMDILPTVTN